MTPYWWERAACRLEAATEFDAPGRVIPGTRARIRRAQAVCRTCPVVAQCLTEARANRDSGVRGGLLLDHGNPVNIPEDRPWTQRPPTAKPVPIRVREVDDIAVEHIMAGTIRVPSGHESVDLIEAVRRLAVLGRDDETIAARLGRTTRAVCKLRSRHSIPAGSARNSRRKVA